MKIATLTLTAIVVASFFFMGAVAQTSPYDPWADLDDDGDIDIFDVVDMTGRYGSTGPPINKTALLLELQARIDELEVIVASHKECIVVTGSIPYDGNGLYDPIVGLSQNVSGQIPPEFTLVAPVATGYKADELTGVRLDEPPLNLEPKVSGMVFQTRVWDARNEEYGLGALWNGNTAHIDYTLFITK